MTSARRCEARVSSSNAASSSEASAVVVVCTDEANLVNQYGERGKDYTKQQAGAAINTFILKLADLGIQSCWIGSFPYEIVKEILKIPEHIHIEAMIPLGYEKGKAKKQRKLELENVIRWENWNAHKRQAMFEKKNKFNK